ncbi:hypothetical protein HZB00_02935 [Candidatus Woesearchaeota archaeon]|nr:hypothetical protein [Candidatus Woesearchaeota archaeon]
MYSDIILFQRLPEHDAFIRRLGFQRTFSHDDLKKINVVHGDNYILLRKALDQKKVDLILNPHLGNRKDHLHYRDSGLNHVLCNLAHQTNAAVGITLPSLKTAEDYGRVQQNIILCRKAKVPVFLFSFAEHPYSMRSVHDLLSFCRILGMSSQEAKRAVYGFSPFFDEKSPRR